MDHPRFSPKRDARFARNSSRPNRDVFDLPALRDAGYPQPIDRYYQRCRLECNDSVGDWSTRLGPWACCACGVLDGLDGKQARVKVETSKWGKLEHWFDAIFEVSWWIAIAYYFQHSGRLPNAFRYLAVLLIAQAIDGLIKSGVRYASGRSIEELGTFERILHFVSGRRNVFVWLLTIGFLLGAPTRAFILMTWLAVATAILHLPRTVVVFSQFCKTRKPHS